MKYPQSSAQITTTLVRQLLVPIVAAFLTVGVTKAQDTSTNPLDGFTPSGLQAGAPTGSFPLSGFDVVNPYNGNLNLSLPLLEVGGRGSAGYSIRQPISTQWTVTYSRVDNGMGGVYEFYEPTMNAGPQPRWYSAGLMVGRIAQEEINPWICPGYVDPVFLPTRTLTRLTFVGPDGTSHEFRDQELQGAPANVPFCATSSANRGSIFISVDGESATFISDEDIYDSIMVQGSAQWVSPSGYLKWRNGTVYRIDGGEVTWIRDRNGNKTTFTYVGYQQTIITDSLNRQITIDYSYNDPTYGLCNRIRYKGFGGAQRTIWVTFGSMSTALRSGYSIQTLPQLFPQLINASNVQLNPYVVTGVWLPNGQRYKFYYNNYAEIARVELPTGGAYEYDWGAGLSGGPASGATGSIIYRRVWERRVYTTGGTGASFDRKITFSRPETFDPIANYPNLGYVFVNQYNSSGTLLTSEKHYYSGGAFYSMMGSAASYSPWTDGKEHQVDIFASNGTTVLRRIANAWVQRCTLSWSSDPSCDPYIASITNTLVDTNQVSETTFTYDQFNNQAGVYEYDYGVGARGPLVRTTTTSYLTTNPINGVNYTSNNIHVRNLPLQRSIYGSIEKTRTSFEYDKYSVDANHAALVSRANISGFDSTFNSGYTTRGNTTGETRFLLSAGGSVTGSIAAYSQYDIAGNVVKGIDGRGNATIFEYDDRYGTPDGSATTSPGPTDLGGLTSYAFATRINRQGQIATAQFDYYLGRIVDGQDLNGIVASVFYDDTLDRLTQVKQAVSTAAANHTVYSYDDTNRIVTSTSDLNVNNDGALIGKTVYDQMGRTCETRQYEGGTNYIATQIQYDILGRAHKTSNPFRPWQSQTAVWTTKVFDALGRVTSVTTPDNAVMTTSYSGNAVTVTDQAGKARKSLTDALGRVTSVYEDPSGLNYQTSYAYDVLDNLITATQGVQTRTYVYDSLKRLTSATNPESGTLTLGYDNNGNLTSRLDARNITTTMTYDALNRITSKSTNDNPQTPTVNFYYDAQTLPSGAPTYDRGFATGRLVAVTYGGTSAGTYAGYDQMGRVVRQYQRTDSVNYLVEASYFANSSTQSVTYPAVPGTADRRVVNYANDSAGRMASISSPARTYAPAASVSSVGYAPHNGLATQTLGNNLINAVTYNNRLQPTEIKLGTSGSPSSIVELDYTYGTTTNNGNVQSIAYAGGGLTYTQAFGYDALNRLTTSQENSGANWSQTNGYDRYGNRWISLGGGTQSLYFTATNNRITGWSYDNSGNLLNDTLHTYTYDAHNKVSKVDNVLAYVYDGTGQRVRKLVGENVRFVYGINGEVVAEFSGASDALLKEYVYGPSGLLATIEPTAINTNGTRYATPDHLGSPRVMTNSSSGVVSRHDYMPFGEEIGSGVGGRTPGMGFIVTDGVRKKFTQQERDSETGLDFFKARYYSSLQGRFTSADSVGGSGQNPQTLNLYAYTMGNPLRFIDPSGNSSEAAHGEAEELQIKGGCNLGYRGGCLWMGQDPTKAPQKPATVLGPAAADGSREIPGEEDVLVINAKLPGSPSDNPGETPLERYAFSPTQTALEVANWASKGIRKFGYAIAPDYGFINFGVPLVASGSLQWSKDGKFYYSFAGPTAGAKNFKFGGQGGIAYFLTPKMRPEDRDGAIQGPGINVSTPFNPIGAYIPETGPPAVTLGWPFSAGVNGSKTWRYPPE